jgi:hypothetical protein
MGTAARRCALERYSWEKNLARIDALIAQARKEGEIKVPVRLGESLQEMRV